MVMSMVKTTNGNVKEKVNFRILAPFFCRCKGTITQRA